MSDETPEEWETFLGLMFSTWTADEMGYMHLTVMSPEYES